MAKYQIIMSIARVEKQIEMDTLLSYQSRIKEVAKKDEELLILEGVVGIMITAQQQRHLSLESYNRLFECEEGNVNIILNFVIRWSLDFLQQFPTPASSTATSEPNSCRRMWSSITSKPRTLATTQHCVQRHKKTRTLCSPTKCCFLEHSGNTGG